MILVLNVKKGGKPTCRFLEEPNAMQQPAAAVGATKVTKSMVPPSDSTHKMIVAELESMREYEAAEAFKRMDQNKDGNIDGDEFKVFARTKGVDEVAAKMIFDTVDTNKNGRLDSAEEWTEACRLLKEAQLKKLTQNAAPVIHTIPPRMPRLDASPPTPPSPPQRKCLV